MITFKLRNLFLLLSLVLITSCSAVVPNSSEAFNSWFNYGKYDMAVSSTLGAPFDNIRRSKYGQKTTFYNFAKLAEFEQFPSSYLKTKFIGEYIWTIYEDVNPCIFNKDFNGDIASKWSQAKLAKEFYLCSSLVDFSPAMIKLAGLIASEDDPRYGSSYEWLSKAASLGNQEAIDIFIKNEINLPAKTDVNNTKSDILFARATDQMFENHNPISANNKWNETMRQAEKNGEGLSDLFKIALVIAAASELEDSGNGNSKDSIDLYDQVMSKPIDYQSYREEARKIGKRQGQAMAQSQQQHRASDNATNNSFSIRPAKQMPLTKPGQAQGLKAVQVQKVAPSSPTYIAPTTSTYAAPNQVIQSRPKQCTSDFGCDTGQKCVKAPLSSSGSCMVAVDNNGIQTFPLKDSKSVLPNMNISGQCQFSTDCPVGFSCDEKLKVCSK
jgi:Tfp pilus assembly protein PilE